MKRMMLMFTLLAMTGLLMVACGGQDTATVEEKPEPAKKAVKIAKQEELKNPQVDCPIMGNPVDTAVYKDVDGKRVYFCCPPCIEKFDEDPKSFIRKMEAAGITLAKAECEEDHDHSGHDHDGGDHDGHDHG